LSFGPALLRPKSHAAEALRQTPEGRFFLETDTSEISIEQVYERAAEVRGIPIPELQRQVQANFEAVFG
jgi:TatD DNase family protein